MEYLNASSLRLSLKKSLNKQNALKAGRTSDGISKH
jgi:hypothetical protein